MDNALRLRALYAVGIHMAHNVMAHFLLARFCHVVVDIGRMAFQLIDLLLCDRKSESFSVSASAIQSLLQVWNFIS